MFMLHEAGLSLSSSLRFLAIASLCMCIFGVRAASAIVVPKVSAMSIGEGGLRQITFTDGVGLLIFKCGPDHILEPAFSYWGIEVSPRQDVTFHFGEDETRIATLGQVLFARAHAVLRALLLERKTLTLHIPLFVHPFPKFTSNTGIMPLSAPSTSSGS